MGSGEYRILVLGAIAYSGMTDFEVRGDIETRRTFQKLYLSHSEMEKGFFSPPAVRLSAHAVIQAQRTILCRLKSLKSL